MSSVADVARLLDPAGWLSLTLPPPNPGGSGYNLDLELLAISPYALLAKTRSWL